MATKYQLTWRPGERRWVKKRGGKRHYIPLLPRESGKVDSYRRCLDEWRRVETRLAVAEQRQRDDLKMWRLARDRAANDMVSIMAEGNSPENRALYVAAERIVTEAEARIDAGDANTPIAGADWAFLDLPDLAKRLGVLPPQPPPPWEMDATIPDDTIAGVADRYVVSRDVFGDTIKRQKLIECALRHFAKHVGPREPVANIDAETMDGYHKHVVKKCGLARGTAKEYLSIVKHWAEWAASRTPLVLPDNLLGLKVKLKPAVTVKAFPLDDFHRLLDEVTPLLRMSLLVMANTGCNRTDISAWTFDEYVDGRMRRRRSKRSSDSEAQVVEHVLWPRTIKAIDAVANKHSADGRVFSRPDGSPICRGTGDTIRGAYSYHAKKTGVKLPQLKLLRKTGSSILMTSDQHAWCVDLFLGHAASSMADRHYAQVPQDRFDRAVRWLEGELFSNKREEKNA